MAKGNDPRTIRVAILDGAGCGGCALEAWAAVGAYEATCGRRLLVDAPAHADLLVLCGDFPPPLRDAVQALARTLTAPWSCMRLGDCAGEPVFEGERRLAGCPPTPQEILRALTEIAAAQEEGPEG